MKKILIAAVALTVLITGACSSDSSAKDKYTAFSAKYKAEFSEISEAFGGDPSDIDQTFEDWIASGEGCESIDAESAAFAAVLLGPTLESHGHTWTEFLKDFNGVISAAKSEGLCNSAAPTTTTTTPEIVITPNTSSSSSSIAATCYEALDSINEGLDAISNGVDVLPYVSATDRAEFLTTAEEFVSTSITTTNLCQSVDPRFTDLGASLQTLLTTIHNAQ